MIAGYDAEHKDCYFDAEAGEKPIAFCEHFLTHVKGPLARQPLLLEDWQKTFIQNLYGWKLANGKRRYRQALLEVARKNGKTTLAALVGLYMLLCDKELGAEIYLAASTRDQAGILFSIIAGMVQQNPALSKHLKVLDSRKRIVFPKTNSFLCAIAAEAGAQHGTNSSCVIYDELHSAPNRDLYDVLQTSQGAREQPLFLVISTSGYDRHSIMYEVHRYGEQVRDKVIDDKHFLPAIYSAPEDADWTKEETWKLANPNYGVSISKDYLKKECKKAQQLPAYENTFRQLHLSQWTEQQVRWIPLEHWRQSAVEEMPNLKVQTCYAGLDLSSTRDLSAFALAFPVQDKVYLKVWTWIPAENAKEREDRDKVPYRVWSKDPLSQLTLTPGNVIDYAYIKHKILQLAEQYDIKEIRYDRWNATEIILQLADEGLTLVPMGQGYASMTAPCKEFEKRVLEHTLLHDNNPVLNWNVSNVAVMTDPAGNIKTCKPEHKEARKIDAVQASIMALSGVMGRQEEDLIYNTRGILTI